ncbi:GMC oxidoreductase [Amniculicola lignicola CBS 123094]|uniref:GMC oxidoreductase n=1 Tax=Amniculicola lignicola CBS 123094 TaxID=1392246 RepID=A0A6A5WP71_9PLEO|nr:GMC oxidoreductase [Amniculicola lignicola CBS 123094]
MFLFSGLILALQAFSFTKAQHAPHGERDQKKTYDYIVVGGGISGLVVANRLTENGRNTVLVVERGYLDNDQKAIVPWWGTGLDTTVMLNFPSAPIPGLNNASFRVPVAAVVGGGSVVNGMAYVRGSRADYDAWEELGNPGWGWDGLFPYFLKSTTFNPPSPPAVAQWNFTWDEKYYGRGPLRVSIPEFQYPDLAIYRDAWKHFNGVVERREVNAALGPGLSWGPSTIDARDSTRATARKAYYDPVFATRPNLHLLTGYTVDEILFQKLTAMGVRIISRANNSTSSVYARKEVILAAGAVQTPQLLQRSGIGPKDVLDAAGIKVKKDSPAVGANFQDHATIPLIYAVSNLSFPNPDSILTNATYNATVWEEYLANKTGPIAGGSSSTQISFSLSQIASTANSIAGRLVSQQALDFLPSIYSSYSPLLKGYEAQRKILARVYTSSTTPVTAQGIVPNGFSASILLKPASRGTITLNSANPQGPPVVQYNTLSNPLDGEILANIVRHKRPFWTSPELDRFHPVELTPGPQYQTDEELISAFRAGNLWPGLAHPSCSCAMLPEALGGCVGPDLKVYGVKKLSIVDASVFPMIVAGPLQATVYAVAEKASDIIKARG